MSKEQSKAPKVIELEVEYEFPSPFSTPPTHVPLVRATRGHSSVPPPPPTNRTGIDETTTEPKTPNDSAPPS